MSTTLSLGLDAMPLNLDFHSPADYNAKFVGHAVVRSLVSSGAASAVAAGVEAFDGHRSWRLTLDTTARWSDGTRVSSADVARSAWEALEHRRTGLAALLESPPNGTPIEVVDDAVVRFNFRRPVRFARELLSIPQLAPRHPAGTGRDAPVLGAYEVDAVHGASVVLRAQPFAGLGAGAPERLVFKVIADAPSAVEALSRGDIDVTPTTGLGQAELDRHRADPRLIRRPGSIFGSLEFGRKAPGLRSAADLRAAIGRSIDRSALCAGLAGLVRPMNSHVDVWDTGLRQPGETDLPAPHVRERVRQALGTEPEVFHADFAPNGTLVARLCAQLAEVFGVAAQPRPLRYEDYVRRVVRQDYALLYTLTVAEYQHPAALLLPWRSGGGPAVSAGFGDVRFDELVDDATGRDGDAGWRAADRRWLDLMPKVPLVQSYVSCLYSDRVSHLSLDPEGLVDYSSLSVGAETAANVGGRA